MYEGTYAGEWNSTQDPRAAAETLASIRHDFSLDRDRLVAVIDSFLGEMKRGLGSHSSSIKMIPSYVNALPAGTETGSVWAIDMGGSNLRVVEVILEGDGKVHKGKEQKHSIPPGKMAAPAPELFDYIVDALVEAGVPQGASIGFTFSYPVQQTAINSGRLIAWTKGFTSAGVVDRDVVELLRLACERRGVSYRLDALVNDTVGTLMARAYIDPRCKMGVILGTGTNACYGK